MMENFSISGSVNHKRNKWTNINCVNIINNNTNQFFDDRITNGKSNGLANIGRINNKDNLLTMNKNTENGSNANLKNSSYDDVMNITNNNMKNTNKTNPSS